MKTFTFLPVSEIPQFIFDVKFSSESSSYKDLVTKNKSNVYFWTGTNMFKPYSGFYWSGSSSDGYAQDEGIGFYFSENNKLAIFFKGNFNKGVLQGNGLFTTYQYSDIGNFDKGSLSGTDVHLSSTYNDDMAVLTVNGKKGFVSRDMKDGFYPKYSTVIQGFSNGKAVVLNDKNEEIVINKSGNFVAYTDKQNQIFERKRLEDEERQRIAEQKRIIEEERLAYYKPQIEAFNNLANKYANYYKSEINQNTGRNPNYTFLSDDYDKEEREVDLTWTGASCGLCPIQSYLIRGRINVSTGEFSWDTNNNAVNETTALNQLGRSAKNFIADAFASLPPPSSSSNDSSLGKIFQSTNCRVYLNDTGYAGVKDNSDSKTETYFSSFTTKNGHSKEFKSGYDDNTVYFSKYEYPINVYVRFVSVNKEVVEIRAVLEQPAEVDIRLKLF